MSECALHAIRAFAGIVKVLALDVPIQEVQIGIHYRSAMLHPFATLVY
jgi:hypothetical protein